MELMRIPPVNDISCNNYFTCSEMFEMVVDFLQPISNIHLLFDFITDPVGIFQSQNRVLHCGT